MYLSNVRCFELVKTDEVMIVLFCKDKQFSVTE